MIFENLLLGLEKEIRIFRKTTAAADRTDDFSLVDQTRGILQQPQLIEPEFMGGSQGRIFYVYVPIAVDVREGDILEIENKKYSVVEKRFFEDLNGNFSHFKLKVYLKSDFNPLDLI